MTKTYRINLDLEFSNDQILTVEHEAKGETIEEASASANLDLSLRVGEFLSRIHPLNFYVQTDPIPHDDEAAAELLAMSEAKEEAELRAKELERVKAAFLRDKLLEHSVNLVNRLQNEPDLCLKVLEHPHEDMELDDIINAMVGSYQGFVHEKKGTAYHDAWLAHGAEKEVKP